MSEMIDLSKIQETQIVKSEDSKTAVVYKVSRELINLEALIKEKENLEAELNMKEPNEKELIEIGKANHPYYTRDVAWIEQRIDEINKILG